MSMRVAVLVLWQYYVAMSEKLAEAVRAALGRIPCSDRQLAIDAGVPPSTVSRIRSGERGATPAVARALADALARWDERCAEAERVLRDALEGGNDE